MTQFLNSGPFAGNFGLDDTLGLLFDAGPIGWTPSHVDIKNAETGADVQTDLTVSALGTAGIDGDLMAFDSPPALSAANGYAEGTAYQVVLKDGTGGNPTNWEPVHTFFVSHETSIEGDTALIIDTETADASAEGSLADNTMIGRLRTLERNQTEVVFPRLKRLLGLLGEHQLVDGFLYDDDGNVTECRIRIFDTKANRDGASVWSDRQNENDPAPALESGEIARYVATMSNLLPRNLRTVYNEAINTDQADNDFTDSVM